MRKSHGLILALAIVASGCVTAPAQHNAVGDYLSARLAARENEVTSAATAFTDAYYRTPDAPEILRDAFFYKILSGDFDTAIILAEELLVEKARLEKEISERADGDDAPEKQLTPEQLDDGLAALTLAASAIKAGDFQRAETYLSGDAISAGYVQPVARIMTAWSLAGRNKTKEAIELLRATPEEAFRGFNPLHVALLADRAGMKDDAKSAHQLSFMSLGGPIGRAAYGAFLERAGDDEEAIAYYEILGRERGADREASRQALARIKAGRPSLAYARTSASEGAAIALYSLGAAFLEQAATQRQQARADGYQVGDLNYNMPLAMTQLALYLDPDLDDALNFAGSVINAQGDHDAAIAMLSRIPRTSPHWEGAQRDIALALVIDGREKEAEKVLKRAARHPGGGFEAKTVLANLYARNDRHDRSVEVLTSIIDQLPDEPMPEAWQYYITRAESLLALDRWPDAERDLKRAVELAPEEATTLNYLGYSWAERGENLDEAFELIEKAVTLQPGSGAIIDSLGWAHYQRGNYDEAVGHLEQAAQIEAGDPTITDHLGDVYWRLGRRVEARFQWERVLELEPDDALRASIEEKLENGLAPAPGQ